MNKKRQDVILRGEFFLLILLAYVAVDKLPQLSKSAHIPQWVLFIVILIGLQISIMAVFKRTLSKLSDNPPTLWNADTVDFPQLDMRTFDDYDTQLTGLGFEPRFCYASETNPKAKGFARLYYHPVHRCIATNGQIFQGNTRIPVAFIVSKLDDNWSLSSRNVKANAIECMWRRPRVLWDVIPGGKPRELLDAHLRIRQRMIDGLGIINATEDRAQQAYFEGLTKNHRQNCEALRMKNIILMYIEFMFYKRKPINSWMGDLEKAVKNHQAFQSIGSRR